jgi:hypothetical protein
MGSRDWIVELLGRETFERLAHGLAGAELQSLLMSVMRARATARTAPDILAQYAQDGFCRPAPLDPRTALLIDAELFAAAGAFEPIELAPVTPLGSCSTLALTDQNRVLSALRRSELVADPTNVLALECAHRLKASAGSSIHLATSHRVVRAQPVPPVPHYARHFRLFALGSAGLEQQDHGFTLETLALHIQTLCAGLSRLERCGYRFAARRLELLACPERAALADRLSERLASQLEGPIERKQLEHPYYSGGLRFTLWATSAADSAYPLGDGGTFDWLTKLTANRRAVYVASGLGSQLIAGAFRAGT